MPPGLSLPEPFADSDGCAGVDGGVCFVLWTGLRRGSDGSGCDDLLDFYFRPDRYARNDCDSGCGDGGFYSRLDGRQTRFDFALRDVNLVCGVPAWFRFVPLPEASPWALLPEPVLPVREY